MYKCSTYGSDVLSQGCWQHRHVMTSLFPAYENMLACADALSHTEVVFGRYK